MSDVYDENNPGHAFRDFYVQRTPVYAPGFGPDDPKQISMARQEFAEECDINVLMAKYEKVGVWPLPPNDAVPQYLDVSDVPDLMGAYAIISEAERAFMTLPATVRREFDNDPVRFVEFAQDPGNLDRMREWKLAAPAPAPVADPPLAPLGSPEPSSSSSSSSGS